MQRFNEAASWLASQAFVRKTTNKILLQKLYYAELRSRFGLSAQMACLCVAVVSSAYKRDKTKCPRFRKYASVPYDKRIMGFKGIDKVSLLTLEGRVVVPMMMGAYQSERFTLAKGQCDLVLRKDGKWFLLVTVDLPEGTKTPASDFIGVDLGVARIATDSDGRHFSGEAVETCRQKYFHRRNQLQKAAAGCKRRGKRPKNIRRTLRRISGKEAAFRKNTNHVISKQLVAKAKDTERGIALEDLEGIRERTRFRKQHRAKMAGWSFHQLRSFIEYKSRLAGVEIVLVDPAYTSRECHKCGHAEKANRPSQTEFLCRACGHAAHADENAALNIRSRARASVMAPIVPESSHEISHAA